MHQPASRTLPTRRSVLGAVLLVLSAAGCRNGHGGQGVQGASAQPEDTAADALREAASLAYADEVHLLAVYDATIARHPQLRTALAAQRSDHAAHADTLRKAGAAPPPVSRAPLIDPVPHAAVAALVRAERRVAAARASQCLTVNPTLAAVLGSISAAEATHAHLLAGLR